MPTNHFYNDFDGEPLVEGQKARRRGPDRSDFQLDRDRIIFSTAFRRLQNKTQVFQAGEYDFYRTRLTHSLEVGTIAKSICQHLLATSDALHDEFHLDLDLVEAISLAHDLGHPPFGHAGERVLHEAMEDYGGFEGNAQSLRILTRIIFDQKDGRFGMAPTRALLDGILKYKRLFCQRVGKDGKKDNNHFIYDDQAEYLEFCFGTSDVAAHLPEEMAPNDFKSLECQIMDAADDIAYSSFDIVDSIKARFLTAREVTECMERGYIGRPGNEADQLPLGEADLAQLEKLRGHIIDGYYDASLNKNIGRLIQSCSLRERDNFMAERSNRYRYELVIPEELKREMKVMKRLARTYVFQSPLLHQMEYKGGTILRGIFEALEKNYLAPLEGKGGASLVLVTEQAHGVILSESELPRRARIICDYLAGMTDAYAVRQYKRLYHPDYGSISEIL